MGNQELALKSQHAMQHLPRGVRLDTQLAFAVGEIEHFIECRAECVVGRVARRTRSTNQPVWPWILEAAPPWGCNRRPVPGSSTHGQAARPIGIEHVTPARRLRSISEASLRVRPCFENTPYWIIVLGLARYAFAAGTTAVSNVAIIWTRAQDFTAEPAPIVPLVHTIAKRQAPCLHTPVRRCRERGRLAIFSGEGVALTYAESLFRGEGAPGRAVVGTAIGVKRSVEGCRCRGRRCEARWTSLDSILPWVTALAVGVALMAQLVVQVVFARATRWPARMSGYAVARQLLHAAGLYDLEIEQTAGATLTYFDMRRQCLQLSADVYHGRHIAAAGFAAQEAVHAMDAVGGLGGGGCVSWR